jgi:hypothetical protein
MWEFNDIRGRAIQELSEMGIAMAAIEKIECARRFDVKGWLLGGYIELLKRAETITDDEAERLGWKTATKLVRLREQFLISNQPTTPTISTTCAVCGNSRYMKAGGFRKYCDCNIVTISDRERHDFTEAVQKEFETEL